MIELGVGADLFRAVGVVFWVVVLAALAAAVLLPKSRKGKTIAVLVVLGLLAAGPGWRAWEKKREQDAYIAQRDKAVAHFEMRCKTVAGEKIHRTVDNVEGILLMKLRPEKYSSSDQNAVDPYGHDFDGQQGFDSEGDAYTASFLWGRDDAGRLVEKVEATKSGFHYVDVVDAQDGKRYRYTGYMGVPLKLQGKRTEPMFLLKRQVAPDPAPRYGITYDDITTPEERGMWIAGSSLKVIDLQTNEVIAERIGYMVDRGLGQSRGGRQPWTAAARWACPSGQGGRGGQTRDFAEKAIRIKQGR